MNVISILLVDNRKLMGLSCIFIVYNAFAEFIAPKQKRLKHNNRHFAHPTHTHLHPLL